MPRTKPEPRDWVETAPLKESLRVLARRGEIYPIRKDRVLIQEGAVGDEIYIVLDGRLRAYGSRADSDRELTYGLYGPGDLVGEMGLDGGRRSASVVAVEDTVCALVTRRTLERHVAEDPAFAFELLSLVIRRARDATNAAKNMALTDVYGRLKVLFESLAVEQDDGRFIITERLTQKDIGNRLGCAREMVARLLKGLREGGYVDTEGRDIVLVKKLPARF